MENTNHPLSNGTYDWGDDYDDGYLDDYDDEREDSMTDVEADADALRNCGWGTDEDYNGYEDYGDGW